MAKNKPENIEEYKKWLKDKRAVEITNKTQLRYREVTSTIKRIFQESLLWKRIICSRDDYGDQFLINSRGYDLWSNASEPELKIKPYDSFLLKTFRKNILDNQNWPRPPKRGWILPGNWYFRINDIVRTSFVVKYLDGVEFITRKLQLLCEECNVKCEVDFAAIMV